MSKNQKSPAVARIADRTDCR